MNRNKFKVDKNVQRLRCCTGPTHIFGNASGLSNGALPTDALMVNVEVYGFVTPIQF